MPATDFLPRSLHNAFSKTGWQTDPLKGLMALQNNPEFDSYFDNFLGTRSGTWPAGTPYASTINRYHPGPRWHDDAHYGHGWQRYRWPGFRPELVG